jgi:Flp pilus assembly protein TadB
MGWLLLILVLIAAAFGVLGAVIKATVFVVITIVFVVLALATIAVLAFRQQTRKMQEQFERRLQPPKTDYPPDRDDRY